MARLGGLVDVSDKDVAPRRAVARCVLSAPASVIGRIRDDSLPKKDPVGVARAAGLLAAKKAADLIPHCHPIVITEISLDFSFAGDRAIVTCEVKALDRTGPEMEALCGASTAALTLYDLIKGIHAGPRITDTYLMEKEGGKSGHWRAEEAS